MKYKVYVVGGRDFADNETIGQVFKLCGLDENNILHFLLNHSSKVDEAVSAFCRVFKVSAQRPSSGGEYLASPGAMIASAAKPLARAADIVIVLWDGKSKQGITAYHEAKKKKKIIRVFVLEKGQLELAESHGQIIT